MLYSANLNKSYFTDRQDRYLLFSSAPELSSYCFDFLKTTSSFSYKLLPSSPPDDIGARPIPYWPHPSIHPHHIESQAKHSLSNLQRHYNVKSGNIQEHLQREDSVVIFPVIQAGQFDIREEEECVRQLFDHLDPAYSKDSALDFNPLLNLTSGYFGLSRSYKDLILRSHILTRIICASPEVRFLSPLIRRVAHCRHLQANGFYGSKGISSRLPEGYTWLEQQFMGAVRASQLQGPRFVPGSVELKEWNRPGWTYHAKGVLTAFPHVVKLTVGLVYLSQEFGYHQIQGLCPSSHFLDQLTSTRARHT